MKFKEIMEQARSRIKHVPGTLVDHGHVIPQGEIVDSDIDMNVVKQLIRKGHLAPFYEGLSEPCKNYHNDLLYDTECPICFLFYPTKLNRTRCCDKSICTECFLQLRRSQNSPLVSAMCPFCVQPNFGVLYIPPTWSKFHLAFKKKRADLFEEEQERRHWVIEPNDPDVVLVDTVRPKWDEVSEELKSSSVGTTRRRRVQLNNGLLDNHETRQNQQDPMTDINLEDIIVMEAIRMHNNTTITH